MPTPFPNIDMFNPLLGELLAQFEVNVFPEDGFESCQSDVVRHYHFHFKLPYVRLLIEDVLSGRWGIGTTQAEVADRLGMDRTRLSDARRRGELSMDLFIRLRSCPSRPADWEPNSKLLFAEMDRSGFIGAARYMASLVPDRPGLVPEQLNELNYELLCELLCSLTSWTIARINNDAKVGAATFKRVIDRPTSNVVPSWYSRAERSRVEHCIERLRSEPDAAFEHLRALQANWQDVFVATHSQLETVRWSRS